MPLSRAEIQKRYREKKKETDGDAYLARERARQKRNYVPVDMLTKSARKKRNEKTKERVQNFRKRQKLSVSRDEDANGNETIDETSGYETQESSTSRLIVKLPNARRNGPKKRLSKAMSEARRKVIKLKHENETLRRKLKTTQRKLQRSEKSTKGPLTPRRKTEQMLRSAGISKEKASKIRRNLMLGNVLIQQIKDKGKQKDRETQKMLYGTVAGKVVNKYRCVSQISKAAKLNRQKIMKVMKEGLPISKQKRTRVMERLRKDVTDFLEREDNCRMEPGKKSATKTGDGTFQTRVLTDYLSNLHQKFLSENPTLKISLATFCRIRPKYIKLTNCLSRNACLCTKHQNFALKLKAFRKEGLNVTQNPDEFIKQEVEIDVQKLPEIMAYSKWKRVMMKDNKQRMKIVQEETNRDNFYNMWKEEVNEFKEHIQKVQTQYAQSRLLKLNLPSNEVIVHMDFSENYTCKSAEEIQSAYWNQSTVTLHPIVAYYKSPECDEIKHKSYVAVSDTPSHSSSTVLAILHKFYEICIPEQNEIKHVHYWTDSPTSQYRNRFIFNTICNHANIFGFPATWNYFEAGHGKGPCDGVGGTTKRMADRAVNSGKYVIQDADDFYSWAKKSTMQEVQFFFVPNEECEIQANRLQQLVIPPVKGTIKLHAVKVDNDKLAVRDTSCYCTVCLEGGICETWRKIENFRTTIIGNIDITDDVTNIEAEAHVINEIAVNDSDTEDQPVEYETGDYVAAVYDNQWYVGQVSHEADEEGEIEISFMERKRNLWQWPNRDDKIWCDKSDILCKVGKPMPNGKSMRMFKLLSNDLEKAEAKFSAR